MTKYRSYITLLIITICIITTCRCEAFADTVAFGYFINRSENRNLDYLKQVLPNSFASSLRKKFNVNSIKPGKIAFLKPGQSEYADREIRENDLIPVSPFIGADFFVFGSYEPAANNRIKLRINIYRTYSNRVFSFVEEGQLETEIFRLVDRIAYQIKNVASDKLLFKSEAIAKNSKVGILTNIEGVELNTLYYEFLKNGFRIASMQGNELYTHLDEKRINSMYTITASNAYYTNISDWTSIDLPYGTWSGARYTKELLNRRDTYRKYAFNFGKTFDDFLKRMRSLDANLYDYYIIIGFNKESKTAWIRCLSLKNNRLIMTETGIDGDNIEEISQKIILALSSGLPEKF